MSVDEIAQPITKVPQTLSRRASRLDRMADAIEKAISNGQLDLANRLANTSIRLRSDHQRLNEAIARLRLNEDNPEAALAILDCHPATSNERCLLRAACLVALGQKGQAHLELLARSQRPGASSRVHQLLALLEWESGDEARAVSGLHENSTWNDPSTLKVLIAFAIERGSMKEAQRLADRLAREAIYPTERDGIQLFLASLNLARSGVRPAPHRNTIRVLTHELLEAETLIETLMEAQRREFDAPSARLLLASLAAGVDRFSDPPAIYLHLAELARELDGQAMAVAWIETGLEAFPMSAPLRLKHAEIVAALRAGSTQPTEDAREVVAKFRQQQVDDAEQISGKAA